MLTIFIPTFNRLESLAPLIDLLVHQIDADDAYADFFRIHVSDNASNDGTGFYLSKINKKYFAFETLPLNIGADFNIKRASVICNTRYLWIHGDDDYACGNIIKSIYDHLLVSPSNLVYMPAKWLEKPSVSLAKSSFAKKCSKVDAFDFIKSSNVKITFITSFIINYEFYKSQIGSGDVGIFEGTNFEHLELILPAVRSKSNLFLFDGVCIFATGNKKFNYSVVDAFGVDFPGLLERAFPDDQKIVRLIVNKLIVGYLPVFICGVKSGMRISPVEVNWRGLHLRLNSYFLYWIFVYPLKYLPLPVSLTLMIFSRIFR